MFEKLLNWKKPHALSWEDWNEWHYSQRQHRPVAYWVCETLSSGIDMYVIRPISNIPYWFRVRFFDRYHIINTGLPPGYADMDTRLLHGMFNMLVDFVEIEKAHMNTVFNSENTAKLSWWSRYPFKFCTVRNASAGLEYLAWEQSLDSQDLDPEMRSDQQAHAAREVQDLYDWWKIRRPLRPDPMDSSGWNEWYNQKKLDNLFCSTTAPDEREDERIMLDHMHKVEEQYQAEDEAQLIRLIKIRRDLWT